MSRMHPTLESRDLVSWRKGIRRGVVLVWATGEVQDSLVFTLYSSVQYSTVQYSTYLVEKEKRHDRTVKHPISAFVSSHRPALT
jgi:gentisate 1,2-dioxygenase